MTLAVVVTLIDWVFRGFSRLGFYSPPRYLNLFSFDSLVINPSPSLFSPLQITVFSQFCRIDSIYFFDTKGMRERNAHRGEQSAVVQFLDTSFGFLNQSITANTSHPRSEQNLVDHLLKNVGNIFEMFYFFQMLNSQILATYLQKDNEAFVTLWCISVWCPLVVDRCESIDTCWKVIKAVLEFIFKSDSTKPSLSMWRRRPLESFVPKEVCHAGGWTLRSRKKIRYLI
ncbi:unnamed protein product [Lactuca virosa]|uniref:Uncharacterized protein n=1 Tax=Lactuca virosa TaxID=75947 RepID=A0AAU9PFD8_9ASTR|nr:unnamed protein product [Lactuca virosa]